jgi:ankyrin repeat protein
MTYSKDIQLFFNEIKRVLLFLVLCAPYLLFIIYYHSTGIYHDPNKDIIDLAIQKNQISEIIKTIKSDESIEKEYFGTKALEIAVNKGNYLVVKSLLEAGVVPNIREYADDSPILLLASSQASYFKNNDKENRMKIVQILLEYGADVNARAGNGESPIFAAVTLNNLSLTKLLISQGADVNIKNESSTPLKNAVFNCNNPNWDENKKQTAKEIVKVLLAAGANPYQGINDKKWGDSALERARMQNNEELILLLQTSKSTNSLKPYQKPKDELSFKARNLDQEMRGRGFKINPQIYQFITDQSVIWLFLPSILIGLYGTVKNDQLFLGGSFVMFAGIILTFIYMISTFKDS